MLNKPVGSVQGHRSLLSNEDLAIAFWNRQPIAVYLNDQEVDRAPRIAHLNQNVVTLSADRMYERSIFEFQRL
jgi:hypothetical protein